MTKLYSTNDMKLLEDNIGDIIYNARRYSYDKKKVEPDLKEYNNVMDIIKNYISKNNKIIYGGFGWNELIKSKNKEDAIYSHDMVELPDIEFYSNDPIEDMKNLVDILDEKGFKFVQGQEAQHEETYSVFVNFHQYCDISYMPSILFNKMPTMTINNLKISHPKFILIDVMRQYNDPITSFWRVEKNLKRANILLKHYDLKFKNSDLKKIKITSTLSKFLDFTRKEIIQNSKLLIFGYYAYEYYKSRNEKKNDNEDNFYVPYYDVISTDLENDAKLIYEKLIKLDSNITIEEYHPFFQFLDVRITFKYDGETFLNLYGGNKMCIPYFYLETKKIHIVTFPYMVQTLLILNLYHMVHNNITESKNMDIYLENIIKIRNQYLKSNNKTILDDTPFQEFRIDCIGDTMTQDRKFRLKAYEKISKKQKIKIRYNPGDKFVKKEFSYKNSSGNKKSKNYILSI